MTNGLIISYVEGIGSSVPRASFFKSNFERLAWYSDKPIAIKDDNTARLWATTKVINAIAQETMMAR